jgi:hypothetical protein
MRSPSVPSENGSIVACHLEGDFLGSPLDLRFIFRLSGENIAELEIVP